MVKKGTKVEWKWGSGVAEGIVENTRPSKTTVTTKHHKITRNGTEKNPAVKIKQSDGTIVLKSQKELKKR